MQWKTVTMRNGEVDLQVVDGKVSKHILQWVKNPCWFIIYISIYIYIYIYTHIHKKV